MVKIIFHVFFICQVLLTPRELRVEMEIQQMMIQDNPNLYLNISLSVQGNALLHAMQSGPLRKYPLLVGFYPLLSKHQKSSGFLYIAFTNSSRSLMQKAVLEFSQNYPIKPQRFNHKSLRMKMLKND